LGIAYAPQSIQRCLANHTILVSYDTAKVWNGLRITYFTQSLTCFLANTSLFDLKQFHKMWYNLRTTD
jgi:hypothetical protein